MALPNAHFGHDFSRIQVYPEVPTEAQTNAMLNAPRDEYEQAANRIAEQVMSEPNTANLPLEKRGMSSQELAKYPRANPSLRPAEMDDNLEVSQNLDSLTGGSRGEGSPLPKEVRAFMEPRLGHNFSDVRVHTDRRSEESAKQIGARAYTVGKDVVFGKNQYSPDTAEGRRLLAHELAHVVQQSTGETAGRIQRQVEFAPEEGSTIVGDRRADVKGREVAGLRFASNRAKINALQFANQVKSACQAFENYAEPKVETLEGEITAGDLVNTLLSVALAPVGGAVTAKITNEIAKSIASAVVDQITDAMKSKAVAAASNKDDVSSLKQAIKSLTMGADDAATNIQEQVGQVFDPIISTIVQKLNADEPLSGEENDIVGDFYEAPPDVVDEILENYYGVPGSSSAINTQLGVYQNLVQEFERRYLIVTSSLQEQLLDFQASISRREDLEHLTFAGRARRIAATETQRRREGLKPSAPVP